LFLEENGVHLIVCELLKESAIAKVSEIFIPKTKIQSRPCGCGRYEFLKLNGFIQ
jgi:hypothetical protein